MIDLTTLLSALGSMTRRKPEVVSPTCIRAAFKNDRYLELSKETKDAVSAWSAGTLLVSGKPVQFAVLVGRLFEPARLPQIMGKAKAVNAAAKAQQWPQ